MTRKTLTSLALSAAFALVSAVPAAAQSQDNSAPVSPTPNFQINASFMPDTLAPTVDDASLSLDDQAAPKTHTMGDRQVFLRVQGGLVFCCTSTGFLVGAGVSGQPKNVKNLEIAADVNFGRLFSANFIYFSANGLYDIHLTGQKIMPYAGAGIGIAHDTSFGGTNTALQILGGVQLPIQGERVVRVEIRWLFTTQTITFLMGSITF